MYSGEGSDVYQATKTTYASEVDAEYLGKSLKRFALKNNVELKSVVVGSCESETAAKSLAKGFSGEASATGKSFNVRGLRGGFESKVKGPQSLSAKYGRSVKSPAKSQYMILEKDKPSADFLYADELGRTNFSGLYYPRGNEAEVPLNDSDLVPSISGEELQGFVNTGEFSRAPRGSLVDFAAHY